MWPGIIWEDGERGEASYQREGRMDRVAEAESCAAFTGKTAGSREGKNKLEWRNTRLEALSQQQHEIREQR